MMSAVERWGGEGVYFAVASAFRSVPVHRQVSTVMEIKKHGTFLQMTSGPTNPVLVSLTGSTSE